MTTAREARRANRTTAVTVAKADPAPTATTPIDSLDALDALPVVELAVAPVTPEAAEIVVPVPETPTVPAVDVFANLPMVEVAGEEIRDFSKADADKISNPRKYTTVHATAVAEGLGIKKGWKHSNQIFILGSNRHDRKPTTVHGMIQAMATKSGKTGIPAPVLVARLRQGQLGNKRSHFCEGLPPTGWAEGWIDTAVTKGILKVAGVITKERAEGMAEEAAEATSKAA